MNKPLISLICIIAVFAASPAFAYKRDMGSAQPATAEQQAPSAPETPAAPQAPWDQGSGDDYGYGTDKGQGVVTAGYVLVIIGGMAAIAGSTLLAADDDQRTLGAIIGGSGAALSLGGSLMIAFGGQSSYAVGPRIDPATKSYGLAMAANF
jgi:hypothetical protein